MKETYNTHTASQVLYLTSPYLNGNWIKNPGKYDAPTNPEQYPTFAKNSYSSYDYFKIDSIIKPYTDENGKHWTTSNDSAKISYYELLYNFTRKTENHTDNTYMDFTSQYRFDRVNESILITIFHYVFAITVLMLACVGLGKIMRK